MICGERTLARGFFGMCSATKGGTNTWIDKHMDLVIYTFYKHHLNSF